MAPLSSIFFNKLLANDLDKLKIPVGGDQLTRVRLQGAKACQDGALTAADRLEHMEPIIVEMFHTLQDLLEIEKYLMKLMINMVFFKQLIHVHSLNMPVF